MNASRCDFGQTMDFFDRIIGLIEDIVISSEFLVIFQIFKIRLVLYNIQTLFNFLQQKQNEFLEKNYELFTDDEENKICYMDIFNEYTKTIEKLITEHLKANVCDEEMSRFLDELR